MTKIQVANDLVIDPQQRRVLKSNVELSLPERSYRLLLTLVESAPNIVSHDELIGAVWPDRVISDENLKQRISRLRRILGDPSDKPNYIVAERGLGYRCIATVTPLTEPEIKPESEPAIIEEPARPFNHLVIMLLCFVVLSVATLSAFMLTEDEPPPVAKVGEFTARDYNRQATEYYYRFKPGDNFTAIELYKKAIETDPNFTPAYAGLGNAYAQGYYQYGQGEDWLQQAISYSNRAIEIAPDQPRGYKSLGLAYHLGGRLDESAKAYHKAIELAPWWPSPVNNIGYVHLEAGRLVKAYQMAFETIKMDTKDPIPYLFLGLAYRDLGMPEHALKAINRSVMLKPDYLLAQNYLAEYHLSLAQYQKALALVEKTVMRAPKNQFGFWLNAQIQLQTGDETKAIRHFEQVAELGGRYQLIAKTYLAVLSQNNTELLQLSERVNSAIAQGNQWAEVIYTQGLIAVANKNYDAALVSFEQAVEAGLRPFYLQNHAILPGDLTQMPAFKALVLKQSQKLAKARQTVMSLEKARRDHK